MSSHFDLKIIVKLSFYLISQLLRITSLLTKLCTLVSYYVLTLAQGLSCNKSFLLHL